MEEIKKKSQKLKDQGVGWVISIDTVITKNVGSMPGVSVEGKI